MKKHKTVRQDKTMDKSFFEELKLLMPTAMVSDFRSIIYGRMERCLDPNVWLFIPDCSEEEQTQASHPSPNKGKPLYSRVSNLKYGGKVREARVSGDRKLELTLMKNGQLADLGELVQDLMTAYENITFEQEMEEYARLCEPAA
jgi:hypothetical protein